MSRTTPNFCDCFRCTVCEDGGFRAVTSTQELYSLLQLLFFCPPPFGERGPDYVDTNPTFSASRRILFLQFCARVLSICIENPTSEKVRAMVLSLFSLGGGACGGGESQHTSYLWPALSMVRRGQEKGHRAVRDAPGLVGRFACFCRPWTFQPPTHTTQGG